MVEVAVENPNAGFLPVADRGTTVGRGRKKNGHGGLSTRDRPDKISISLLIIEWHEWVAIEFYYLSAASHCSTVLELPSNFGGQIWQSNLNNV